MSLPDNVITAPGDLEPEFVARARTRCETPVAEFDHPGEAGRNTEALALRLLGEPTPQLRRPVEAVSV